MAVAGAPIAVLLFFLIPKSRPSAESKAAPSQSDWARKAMAAFGAVFRNPQSILCGLIAGLMFLPTTTFDMVWGVRFLQESHDVPYSLAVLRSASVPFGWIIGCPLLGALSDRLGRRKPVIIGGAIVLLASLVLILYGPPDLFPTYSLGLVAGIASGAAMLPYTVIKEANRPEHSGTATGVINFINFSLSAVLGPVFGSLLMRVSAGGERELAHYQAAFQPLVYGIAAAIVLTLFLRETGPANVTRGSQARPSRADRSKGAVTRWQARRREFKRPTTVPNPGSPSPQASGPRKSMSAISSRTTSRRTMATVSSSPVRPNGRRRSGQSSSPCSPRSARRASSTSRRSRARSPRMTPAISTRKTRSLSGCRPMRPSNGRSCPMAASGLFSPR